jgi:hypothetical protein
MGPGLIAPGAGDIDDLAAAAERAIGIADIQSAAIFVTRPGSTELELGGAAGIAGPPLDGLRAAVRNPDHPIRRTMLDDGPTFDVRPTAPGGPALRSHLPLFDVAGGQRTVVGVLAVAHDRPLDPAAREALGEIAIRSAVLARGGG